MSKDHGKGKQYSSEEDWNLLPVSVKRLPNWGVYDTEGNKRPTSVLTGHSKGWNLPENWGTFDQAVAFRKTHPEFLPGFFFSVKNRVVGLDLDACRNPKTGEIESWALEVIDTCDTYTEVSLSGSGVKLLGKSDNWVRSKIV